MKIIDFFKDKSLFLAINLIVFIIILGIMIFAKISLVIIFLVWFIWFVPLLTYIILDYIKYRKYFSTIESLLDRLDKKYLLPEVIEEANFLIGENINNILKIIGRDMHENVKYYKNMQKEYREYIETWVHEIKTPIASTRLLIENNNNEVTKKIDMQIDKIENFVEQVLYYSRSDEASKDYIIKEVNLNHIVKKVIKRNYRDFISKKIILQLEEINEIVYCDVKWVEFILNQIIGNSIKYIQGRQGKIKITSQKLANSVVLKVEDNGVGIVERDINIVFEKGFTGENGRKFGKSTGMGLYLCRKLCLRLGMQINISSKVNEGTKVSLIFPLSSVTNVVNQ